MKKQLIIALGLTALITIKLHGQFSNAPGLLTTNQSIGARVGIGVGTPLNSMLEVRSSSVNQFRIANNQYIFTDFNTNNSGVYTVMPNYNGSLGRASFGTTSPLPGVGFQSNMGALVVSTNSSATRYLKVNPNSAAINDIPAGVNINSGNATSGEGLSLTPNISGAAGLKLGAYAFRNGAGGGWKSIWETQK